MGITSEVLTKFRNQLKSEIDISINIAKEIKSYKDGYTSWLDFKNVALKLQEKSTILSEPPHKYDKFLDRNRIRFIEEEDINPYADFDCIFEEMMESEDYDMIASSESLVSSLYTEFVDEHTKKEIEAGLF